MNLDDSFYYESNVKTMGAWFKQLNNSSPWNQVEPARTVKTRQIIKKPSFQPQPDLQTNELGIPKNYCTAAFQKTNSFIADEANLNLELKKAKSFIIQQPKVVNNQITLFSNESAVFFNNNNRDESKSTSYHHAQSKTENKIDFFNNRNIRKSLFLGGQVKDDDQMCTIQYEEEETPIKSKNFSLKPSHNLESQQNSSSYQMQMIELKFNHDYEQNKVIKTEASVYQNGLSDIPKNQESNFRFRPLEDYTKHFKRDINYRYSDIQQQIDQVLLMQQQEDCNKEKKILIGEFHNNLRNKYMKTQNDVQGSPFRNQIIMRKLETDAYHLSGEKNEFQLYQESENYLIVNQNLMKQDSLQNKNSFDLTQSQGMFNRTNYLHQKSKPLQQLNNQHETRQIPQTDLAENQNFLFESQPNVTNENFKFQEIAQRQNNQYQDAVKQIFRLKNQLLLNSPNQSQTYSKTKLYSPTNHSQNRFDKTKLQFLQNHSLNSNININNNIANNNSPLQGISSHLPLVIKELNEKYNVSSEAAENSVSQLRQMRRQFLIQ